MAYWMLGGKLKQKYSFFEIENSLTGSGQVYSVDLDGQDNQNQASHGNLRGGVRSCEYGPYLLQARKQSVHQATHYVNYLLPGTAEFIQEHSISVTSKSETIISPLTHAGM